MIFYITVQYLLNSFKSQFPCMDLFWMTSDAAIFYCSFPCTMPPRIFYGLVLMYSSIRH